MELNKKLTITTGTPVSDTKKHSEMIKYFGQNWTEVQPYNIICSFGTIKR